MVARRVVLASLVVLVVLVTALAGLLLKWVRGSGGDPSPAAQAAARRRQEDAVADRPMLRLPDSAAQPQPQVSATAGAPIPLPAPTVPSVAGGPPVRTGFPRTSEGALAQLAAIDEGAFSTTDLAWVRQVYAWAARPGAVPEAQWSPALGIASLRDSLAGTPGRASFHTVEGQIKGTVGPDYVVACVLGVETLAATSTVRVGIGDCQRMVWSDGRWWIGPGAQPFYPPSAWPGSADAVRGGWRALQRI